MPSILRIHCPATLSGGAVQPYGILKVMNTTPTPSNNKLTESPRHWKSLLVYLALVVCLIDAPLQYVILDDVWGVLTSVLLAFFLAIESYGRFFRSQTYLGKTFAPALSVVIILLVAGTYLVAQLS